MTVPIGRLGAAPISWGVCEVPGWGRQLPAERVLAEMAGLGFTRVELGAAGYLATKPSELADQLGRHGLGLLGAFVPVVVHNPAEREATWQTVRDHVELLAKAGGTYFITAPVLTWDWGERQPLDADAWATTCGFLDEIETYCADHGLLQAVHPHLGTVLERADEVQRVLDNSAVGFTLDTGHLQIGGYDPVDFVVNHSDRITHVHLKDVVMDLARPVLEGAETIMAGVQQGMFCVLGQGDVPIASVIERLIASDFDGWYVIEQDAAITGDFPAPDSGPVLDVAASVTYLRGLEFGPARVEPQ